MKNKIIINILKRVVLVIIIVLMFLPTSIWCLDDSIVLVLLFDEGKGDKAKDNSRYSNNGTLINSPEWTEGKRGNSLLFKEGSYVEIISSRSLHGDFFTEPFTLSAWIKPSLKGDEWQHIFRSVGEQPISGNDTLFININGCLSWRGYVNGVWTIMCETEPGLVKADQWTHVAVVGNRSDFNIFVNGESKKKSNFIRTMGGNEKYCIAFDGRQWLERFNGAIDEFFIISRDLNKSDINEVMNGNSRFLSVNNKSSLVMTWGFLKIN